MIDTQKVSASGRGSNFPLGTQTAEAVDPGKCVAAAVYAQTPSQIFLLRKSDISFKMQREKEPWPEDVHPYWVFLGNLHQDLDERDLCRWLEDLSHTLEGRQTLATRAIWLIRRSISKGRA